MVDVCQTTRKWEIWFEALHTMQFVIEPTSINLNFDSDPDGKSPIMIGHFDCNDMCG